MDQMMGNMFYRGVQPCEIKKMQYWEMSYWNKWHESMANAELKAAKNLKEKGKQKK
jgi:hypothetical protein